MMLLLAFQTASLFGLIVASISTSSMVAEIVETHEVDHGTRIEGVFFAGYLMTQKFGQALGIFLVGQLVAYVGLSDRVRPEDRSEEHTSELQSLMRISYAVFCLKQKKKNMDNHEEK